MMAFSYLRFDNADIHLLERSIKEAKCHLDSLSSDSTIDYHDHDDKVDEIIKSHQIDMSIIGWSSFRWYFGQFEVDISSSRNYNIIEYLQYLSSANDVVFKFLKEKDNLPSW